MTWPVESPLVLVWVSFLERQTPLCLWGVDFGHFCIFVHIAGAERENLKQVGYAHSSRHLVCPQCDCDTWNLKRRDLRSLCVTSTIKMLYLYLRELQVSLYKRFPRPSQFNEFALRVLFFPAAPCDFCHNCYKWLRQVQTKPHIAYSIRKSKENGS